MAINQIKLLDDNGSEYVPYKSRQLYYPSTFKLNIGGSISNSIPFSGYNGTDGGQSVELKLDKIPASAIEGLSTDVADATYKSKGILRVFNQRSGLSGETYYTGLTITNGVLNTEGINSSTTSLSWGTTSPSTNTQNSGWYVDANSDNKGVLTNGSQFIRGDKYFSSLVAAKTLGLLTNSKSQSNLELWRRDPNGNKINVTLINAGANDNSYSSVSNYITIGSTTGNNYSKISKIYMCTLNGSAEVTGTRVILGRLASDSYEKYRGIYVYDSDSNARTLAALEMNNGYQYAFGTGSITNRLYIGSSDYTTNMYLRSKYGTILTDGENSVTLTQDNNYGLNCSKGFIAGYDKGLSIRKGNGSRIYAVQLSSSDNLWLGSTEANTKIRGAFTEGTFSFTVPNNKWTDSSYASQGMGPITKTVDDHGLMEYNTTTGTATRIVPDIIEITSDSASLLIGCYGKTNKTLTFSITKPAGMYCAKSQYTVHWRAWRKQK